MYSDGYTEHKCKDCGRVVRSDVTKALGHNYDSKITTKASCTEDGVLTYICTKCNESYTEKIPATGHKYNDVVTEASCDKGGYTLHTCENCGDIYKDNFTSQLGHDYTSQTVKPTCETDGEKTFTCTRCGDTYTEVIKAKGHVYKRTVVAAGCETDGYTLVECMECHDSFREGYVGAKGHTIVTDKAVAATCTTAGKNRGFTLFSMRKGHKGTDRNKSQGSRCRRLDNRQGCGCGRKREKAQKLHSMRRSCRVS